MNSDGDGWMFDVVVDVESRYTVRVVRAAQLYAQSVPNDSGSYMPTPTLQVRR
jgi:hypothetical protein